MPLLRRSTRIDGWTGEHVYGGAQSETHTVHSDIYIYEPSFLPGLEGPRKGRARRPHAHRPHLSDTKGHSGGPWKANGLHSTAHTGAGQIFVLLRVVSERSMARDGCSS